jgi:hypothetical protein
MGFSFQPIVLHKLEASLSEKGADVCWPVVSKIWLAVTEKRGSTSV